MYQQYDVSTAKSVGRLVLPPRERSQSIEFVLYILSKKIHRTTLSWPRLCVKFSSNRSSVRQI